MQADGNVRWKIRENHRMKRKKARRKLSNGSRARANKVLPGTLREHRSSEKKKKR